MITVLKYPFEVETPITLELPTGAKVLHVGQQGDDERTLFLWALVDPDRPPATRHFFLLATGQRFDANILGPHIGTVQTKAGLVWHVFEEATLATLVQGMFGAVQ